MVDGPLLLAIDEGTTNTKAVLVDARGTVVARASRRVSPGFPQPGWVEQDASALWESTRDAIAACLEQTRPTALAGVAVTNQRESVLVWERETGRPLGPMIVWQCRRTAPFCEELRRRGLEPAIRRKTGLTIDPLFSASKARWLLDLIRDGRRRAEAGELCVGTVDAWLLWNLTAGSVFRTDVSNASRTQLLDLHSADWDPELLDLFGIPRAALPEVTSSSALYGEVRTPALPSLRGVPIAGVAGDSHAALFGQAGFAPGTVKATYGTGSSLMAPTVHPLSSDSGLSTTVAWGISGEVTYALEGNITATGAAVQWVEALLGLEDGAAVSALAETVEHAEGLYLVPAFAGLGAPYWREDARGLITGLTRGTTAAHLARAVLESVAYQIRDVFDLFGSELGRGPEVLLADGGAAASDLLMQFQADLLDRPVLRNSGTDIAALGAAYLAGLHLGVWTSLDEIASLPRSLDRFEPRMSPSVRHVRYDGWKRAVAQTLYAPAHTPENPPAEPRKS